MIIDLKKIERSGKSECDFHFDYVPENNLSQIPNTEIVLPISVTGTVFLTGKHACYIEGEVGYTLKGECTRCLEQTSMPLAFDFALEVDVFGENGYPLKNDMVDLSKIVDDEILMNTPVTLLCDENCKGICYGCGANLNKENCKCEK